MRARWDSNPRFWASSESSVLSIELSPKAHVLVLARLRALVFAVISSWYYSLGETGSRDLLRNGDEIGWPRSPIFTHLGQHLVGKPRTELPEFVEIQRLLA